MSSLREQLSKGSGGGTFVHYSPVGKFLYPKLNKPDVPKDKNGKVKKTWRSTYQVTVEFSKEDQEAMEFIENLRYKDEEGELVYLKDCGGRTFIRETEDSILLTVRRDADRGKPRFFIPNDEGKSDEIEQVNALIWSGTIGSVSFTTYSYDGGVGAGLCGVTIHELASPPPKEEGKSEKKESAKASKGKKKKGEVDANAIFNK